MATLTMTDDRFESTPEPTWTDAWLTADDRKGTR